MATTPVLIRTAVEARVQTPSLQATAPAHTTEVEAQVEVLQTGSVLLAPTLVLAIHSEAIAVVQEAAEAHHPSEAAAAVVAVLSVEAAAVVVQQAAAVEDTVNR